MQTFVVLGLIPGTNIQINFQTWLLITAIIVAIFWLHRTHRRASVSDRSPLRLPLYANQLHRRVQ